MVDQIVFALSKIKEGKGIALKQETKQEEGKTQVGRKVSRALRSSRICPPSLGC